jgi:hypothetical protein
MNFCERPAFLLWEYDYKAILNIMNEDIPFNLSYGVYVM